MEVALYLLPVTLGDTAIEKVLPSYNREIIVNIKHFIVEDVRSARRILLRKLYRAILLRLQRDTPWELFLRPAVRLWPIREPMW